MADNKTIKKYINKASSQAYYTKVTHDHGPDIAYKFLSKDDPRAATRKVLEGVGIYFGENSLDLPTEFDNKWIKNGYIVGKRRVMYNLDKTEYINEEKISNSEKLSIVKEYILKHSGSFSKDEEDLINVGIYYRNNVLELPLEFNNPLILFGYYDIPLKTFYNSEEKHTKK